MPEIEQLEAELTRTTANLRAATQVAGSLASACRGDFSQPPPNSCASDVAAVRKVYEENRFLKGRVRALQEEVDQLKKKPVKKKRSSKKKEDNHGA